MATAGPPRHLPLQQVPRLHSSGYMPQSARQQLTAQQMQWVIVISSAYYAVHGVVRSISAHKDSMGWHAP